MQAIHVEGKHVVNEHGERVMLRGTCLGGWMCLENFIDDFVGCETGLRDCVSRQLGPEMSTLFFDEMLDQFFTEDDARFIASTGANVVRLCVNYRHFEDDEHPFVYKEKGFRRLTEAVRICAKHGLYTVIDLHCAQGWQNSHWHCDNERGVSLLWRNAQYQQRVCALWKEIASRFRDEPAVAGYELLNEPCSNTPNGDYPHNFYGNFQPDWPRFNSVMRAIVHAVREVDDKHILFFEGDMYAHGFRGLEEPYDGNTVYVAHDYVLPSFGPAPYPGQYQALRNDVIDPSGYWDAQRQLSHIRETEAWQFAEKWNVPLCVGEFGAQYTTGEDDVRYRLAAMDDQLKAFNELGIHWMTWTYKDAGVMGWCTLDPQSEYSRMVAPVRRMKGLLGTESFTGWHSDCPGKQLAAKLLDYVESVTTLHYDRKSSEKCMQTSVLGYYAAMLQPEYAACFAGVTAEDVRRIMRSFSFSQCRVNQGLFEVLKGRTAQ
mgnify:CR=1 FL=1